VYTVTIAAGLAIVGALVAALFVYEYYSGENPVLDRLYDSRLRSIDLASLDARSLENRQRADVIVTLTTLPSRIERLQPTIKSLLNQTIAPNTIRLNVPAWSRREQRSYVIPEWLAALRAVTICRTDDFGPATKLMPTLLEAPADARIVIVDDDRIYHPWFIEQMVRCSDTHPDVAVVGSGWDAPPDLTDRPSTLAATLAGRPPVPIKCTRVRGTRQVDVMQGVSGYLVKPRFFDLAAIADYGGAPDVAFLVDDVWISAHCRVPKVIFRGRRTNFQSHRDSDFYQHTGLGRANRGDGTPETRNNTIMLRYFKGRWKVSNS
jgi:hypothetical protein